MTLEASEKLVVSAASLWALAEPENSSLVPASPYSSQK